MAEQITFRCDGVERYRTTARGETIDWVASYGACKVKIEELEARIEELEAGFEYLAEQCMDDWNEHPQAIMRDCIEEALKNHKPQ
jgi:hypothetical protein